MLRQSPFSPGLLFPFSSLTKRTFGSRYLIGSSLSVLAILLHFRLYAKERAAVNAARDDDGLQREAAWPARWPNCPSLPPCSLWSESWRTGILEPFLGWCDEGAC